MSLSNKMNYLNKKSPTELSRDLFINRWGYYIKDKKYIGNRFPIYPFDTPDFWRFHHQMRIDSINLGLYSEFPSPKNNDILKMFVGSNGCYLRMTTDNFKLGGIFINPYNGMVEIFGPSSNKKNIRYGVQNAKKFLEDRINRMFVNLSKKKSELTKKKERDIS